MIEIKKSQTRLRTMAKLEKNKLLLVPRFKLIWFPAKMLCQGVTMKILMQINVLLIASTNFQFYTEKVWYDGSGIN